MMNDTYTSVSGNNEQAALYAGSGATIGDGPSLGGSIFFWLTLTMMWVLMILAILALLKYVTHEGHASVKGRGRAK